MFLFTLLSLSSACQYTIDFTPCINNTKGALIIPQNCTSTSPIFLPSSPCNLQCNAGSKISYSEFSNSLKCSLCEPGTFSLGGGLVIDSWNLHKARVLTYCWILDNSGWVLGNQCTPWHIIDGEYLVTGSPFGNQWYDTLAVLYEQIVKPGVLRIVYRKESKVEFGTNNGEFIIFINGDLKYVDLSSENFKWNTVLIQLYPGPQEIEFVFSGYITDLVNKVQIKEIEIRGTEYASTYCETCAKGFSSQGADHCTICEIGTYLYDEKCLLCPEGTSSEEGSAGVKSCKKLEKCGENDYHFIFSDCVEGFKTKIFEWNFPLWCSIGNQTLPRNEKVACGNCPSSMFFNGTRCIYCAEGFFTEIDGMNTCLQCPSGMYAPMVRVYKDFSDVPKDFLVKCGTKDLNECSYSWEPRGTYLSSSPIYGQGWIASLEKFLKIFHKSAFIQYEFQLIGQNTVFNATLNGKLIKSLVGEFKGSQKFYLPKGNYSIVFSCIHSSSKNEQCIIFNLTVSGGDEGGAKDCLPCSVGYISNGLQSLCEPCDSGFSSNLYQNKCEPCSNLTFSDTPGPCLQCTAPMIPNSNHTYCILPNNLTLNNKTFMVSDLSGNETETSLYCKELRLQYDCLKTFFGPVQYNENYFYLSIGNPSIPDLPTFMSIVDVYSYGFAILDKKSFNLQDVFFYTQDLCFFDYSKLIVSLGSRVNSIVETETGFNLTYADGSECNEYEKFSAEIQFLCRKDELEGWPVYLGADKCRFKFLWPTVHACSKCQEWEVEYKEGPCEDEKRTIHVFAGANCVFDEYLSIKSYEEKCNSTRNYYKTMIIVSGIIGLCMVLLIFVMCVLTVRTKFKYERMNLLERNGSMSGELSPGTPSPSPGNLKHIAREFPDFRRVVTSEDK